MIWIFIAAAIFGGAFLLPMILGGLDSEIGDGFGGDGFDLDVDADVDVDLGPGLDVDTDVGADVDGPEGSDVAAGSANPLGAIFASLVSFRTIVFFSTFFGTSGIVFDILGYSTPVTVATASMIGAIAAVINSAIFGLVKNSQANSQISDRTLEGRPAEVVLPMGPARRGRIRIDLTGQPQYLVALPFDERSKQQFDVGASVVVVKIENGTALVASLSELDEERS